MNYIKPRIYQGRGRLDGCWFVSFRSDTIKVADWPEAIALAQKFGGWK